jgi:cytochrome c-type biogenesis protein CcmH/NrfG
MIKKLLIIIILLVAIAGVGYYGYGLYQNAGREDATSAEELFTDMDQGMIDIITSSPTDAEIAEVEGVPQDSTPVTPESMDALISELDNVSRSDTTGLSASLNDL